jgi:predicted pyridoxine 5'-phosphate oxidase superfamily flavin-nucleotide-binding protein
MAYGFLDVANTPSVRAAQRAMGAEHLWQDFKGHRQFDKFTADEVTFISERDSFYMATVSETNWPYVQHRGGPQGFLKVVDEKTLAFADYRGNRQYISVGNLTANDRAALILMDYPAKARLKIYARVEPVSLEANPELAALVSVPDYKAKPERILLLHLVAFDWNCPQHITPRFTEAEIAAGLEPLRERLAMLEAENANLRAKLALIAAAPPSDRHPESTSANSPGSEPPSAPA